MINITYMQRGNSHLLQIYGHANYDSSGRDIVCAAVSAIAYTLFGFLENHKGEADSISGPQAESGNFYVLCSGGPYISMAFEMALIGLAQIANAYPRNVSLSVSSDRDALEKTADF